MDPAEIAQVKTALGNQGSMLANTQQNLAVVSDHLGQLTDKVEALTQHVQGIVAHLPPPQADRAALPVPPDPAPPVQPSREPRLPNPETYSGEPGSCRSFLSQCSLIFQLQPSSFPNDQSKIAYIITLLAGRAREWGTAIWEAKSAACDTVDTFFDEMRKVFDRSVTGREAARELLHMRQGNKTVSDFAIDFRTLAATCGWNKDALYDAFLNGLSESLKDELASRELPATFDELVDLAIRLDNRLRLRWKEKGNSRPRMQRPPVLLPSLPAAASTPSTATTDATEPMQVNRTRLSAEEYKRRKDSGVCLYCGGPGHFANICPVKGGAHQ